jgi:multiple sugar transport system ATP-binding protein
MGDRVAVLKLGVLQQVGTPAELYNSPNNAFVATFIGSPSMNMVEVPIVDGGAALGDFTLPVERDALAKASGSSLLVGFRPEDFHLSDQGVEMNVTLVENLGSDTYIYGTCTDSKGNQIDLVARDKVAPSIGDTVRVAPTRTYAFDTAGDQLRLNG